jgi:Zn finger protein HypA/HybF involved in hydrogenase expression
MKTCPKCNNEHNKKGKFCNRRCANSRTFSEETKEKKRKANLDFYSTMTVEDRKKFNADKILKYDFDAHQKMVQEKNLERSWSRPYEKMARESLRKRILVERNHTCEQCGIGNTYNGKPLSLELDHIDGNNSNNKVENLRILCPNCHSQTPTYRAKNIKYKRLLKESNP